MPWRILAATLGDAALAATDSVRVDAIPGSIFTSIDTVFALPCDHGSFGQLAVIHCENDLVAAGCRPEAISVSVGVPRSNARLTHQGLMAGMSRQAEADGIQFCKGHTFHSNRVEVTCSVLGTKLSKELGLHGTTLSLIATKPFGCKALFEKAYLAGNFVLMEEVLAQLKKSNADLASVLRDVPWFGTDVSGYGLAGALCLVAQRKNLRIELSRGAIKYIGSQLHSVRICKLIGANERDFRIILRRELDAQLRNVLFESEFCGPVIIFVDNRDESKVLELIQRAGHDAFSFGKAVTAVGEVVI